MKDKYSPEEKEVDKIVDRISDLWMDTEAPINQRKIDIGTGKGGVVLHWQWIQEEFGTKPTPEEIQAYRDTLIDGYYVIGRDGIKGPTMIDDEKPDGTIAMYRYAREVNGVRFGEKYTIETWRGGYGTIDKWLTKEEFEDLLTKNGHSLNYKNEEE